MALCLIFNYKIGKMQLDHVTIRSSELEANRDFFIKVFDLVEKPRPKSIERIPGHWLYYEDEPVVHIIIGYQAHIEQFENRIDHVGFNLTRFGYEEFKQRLDSLEVPYSLMDLKEISERRIFFLTPDKILLEGVFKNQDF